MPLKKFTPILLLAALLAFALVALWREARRGPNPCAAIPTEAAIVLDFNPIDNLGVPRLPPMPNPALDFFLGKSGVQDLQRQLEIAHGLVAHNGSLHHVFQRRRILAAITLRDSAVSQTLFVLDLRNLSAHVRDALSSSAGIRQFRSDTLWVARNHRGDFIFAQKNGLLVFSPSTVLVEDALANLDAGDNWWSRCPFLREPEPTERFRVLIRTEVLAQRLSDRMLPAAKHLPQLLARQAEWLGLTWQGSGFSTALGPAGWLRQMPDWGQSPSHEIFATLPAHTALVLRAGFDEPSVFMKKMGAVASPDWRYYVAPWWGREVALVVTEPLSNDLSDHQFVVLAARDTAAAAARLTAYGLHRGLLKNYDYQTFVLRQFAESDLLRPLVGEESAFQNPACAVVGNHVVFAASTAALERWIDQYMVGETLSANIDFLQMAQSLPTESGASVLLNPAALPALAPSLWPRSWMQSHAQELQALAALAWVGADFRPSGSAAVLDVQLANGRSAAPAHDPRTPAALVWKTALAADAAMPPQITYAPWEVGGASIWVQDVRHQLYRLNTSGQLRWRRQMPGPILSEVQAIDFLHNQTACYFFNTPDALWLLDENGRDVEGFPMRLRTPALNGAVALPSDEGYHFFFALENGNVQGINQFGRPLEGWNPQQIGGEVTAPVLHFYHDGGDYFAVLTRSGRLSVFGKNGQPRFPPVQFEGRFEGAMQVNMSALVPCIVCINDRGQAFGCDVRGRSLALPLSPVTGGGARSGFGTLDYGPDFEYAVLSGQTLTYGEGEEGRYCTVFSQKNEVAADAVFVPQAGCAGVLHKRLRRVTLHREGDLADVFEGSTAFRLLPVSDKRYLLVVGNGPSVCGYGLER